MRGVRSDGSRPHRSAGYFYLGVGFLIATLWAVSLPGAFDDGLFDYAGTAAVGNIPVFHLIAELTMAVVCLLAGRALIRGTRLGRAWALTATGMLVYSSLNSSGWLVQNQPGLVVVTTATLVGSVLAALVVVRSRP